MREKVYCIACTRNKQNIAQGAWPGVVVITNSNHETVEIYT